MIALLLCCFAYGAICLVFDRCYWGLLILGIIASVFICFETPIWHRNASITLSDSNIKETEYVECRVYWLWDTLHIETDGFTKSDKDASIMDIDDAILRAVKRKHRLYSDYIIHKNFNIILKYVRYDEYGNKLEPKTYYVGEDLSYREISKYKSGYFLENAYNMHDVVKTIIRVVSTYYRYNPTP